MPPERLPRTIVLSDLHLGRPGGAGGAAAFEALVGDCDRLIVNGDSAELHHEAFRADAERELDRFRDLCVTRGVRVDLIAGNHDPFVSDLRSLELADGAVYITHGDALHPDAFVQIMQSAEDFLDTELFLDFLREHKLMKHEEEDNYP